MEKQLEELEKENAALKRELEEQRFRLCVGLQRICFAVNSTYVLLVGKKPCSDWMEHGRENWGEAFDKACASDGADRGG